MGSLVSFNEAGAASPRKSQGVLDEVLGGLRASMRPGQLRPGNVAARINAWVGALSASMRPGQLRPGNPSSRRPPASCARRFNEAGAASPRKWPPGSKAIKPIRRFNEAGAASPRK